MKKVKVVQVVEAMLGGIRQHVIDIVENLDTDKYENYLIYSPGRADKAFFDEIGKLQKCATLIACDEMQRELGINDFGACRALIKHFKVIKPDIVHCHSSKAGIVGRMAAKKCGIKKIIYTPNAYAFEAPDISSIKRYVYISAERFLSRYATSITINVSKGEQNLAYKYGLNKKDKFILIYNAIPNIELPEKSILKKELGLKDNVHYVGVTARCARQKDPITFLKIAQRVVQEIEDVEFLYIGDGEMMQEMKIFVKEHTLEDKVHLLGFRSDASIIVGVLDVYLSTALYEGLPYSMIEAMRAGVPIIATDVVGNKELVTENVNGFKFEVEDISKGAQLVIEQIKDNTIHPDDVRASFFNDYELKKMIERIDAVYDEI